MMTEEALHQAKLEQDYVASLDLAVELDSLLANHAAAWWRDTEATDFVERVNETYNIYLAAGGSDTHYDANWRRVSDAARKEAQS